MVEKEKDITERLREGRNWQMSHKQVHSLLDEAADEIERLRQIIHRHHLDACKEMAERAALGQERAMPWLEGAENLKEGDIIHIVMAEDTK